MALDTSKVTPAPAITRTQAAAFSSSHDAKLTLADALRGRRTTRTVSRWSILLRALSRDVDDPTMTT